MTELLARIKALLRHPGVAFGTVLTVGNLAFDGIGREVAVAGRRLELSCQELALLEQLLRRLGRVVPRAVLEQKFYGYDTELASNPVPVYVHHLRRRLEAVGASVGIHTVRWGRLFVHRRGHPLRFKFNRHSFRWTSCCV